MTNLNIQDVYRVSSHMVAGNRAKNHQKTFKIAAKSKMAANIYVAILIF